MSTMASEYRDDYPRVVVMLDARTRVIEGADNIQWIMQKKCRGPRPWRGKLYFRSKAGLIFYAPRPTPPEIMALPDWFVGGEAQRASRPRDTGTAVKSSRTRCSPEIPPLNPL
jgi:hypothetical protein